MGGNYQTKEPQYSKYLDSWMKKVIEEKAWEKYADLHIDEIADEFKISNTWVEASLFIHSCLLKLIDKSKYDILLSIPLSYSNSRTSKGILDLPFLMKNLNHTPPSFYLFPIENENFKKTIEAADYLQKLSYQLKYSTYYKEEKEDNEYFRLVFISSNHISD